MKDTIKLPNRNRRVISLFIAFLILPSFFFFEGCEDNETPKEEPPVFEAHFTFYDTLALAYVNKYRDSIGAQRLLQHEALWVVANEHSVDMKNGKVTIGHDGFDERVTYLQKWMTPTGFGHVGENVAYIKISNINKLVSYWLSSSTHKANLDGSYEYAGLSCVPDSLNDYCFITMMLYE